MYEVLHQNAHMQGFTTDGTFMYWSFTDSLVKTTLENTVIAQMPVLGGHMGDIDYHDGKIYATVMGNSLAGRPWGVWTSFYVYVFDAENLSLLKMIRLDPCYDMYADYQNNGGFNGVDGIAIVPDADGRLSMWVAAALFNGEEYDSQMLLHFTLEGKLIEIKKFKTGNTIFGIQNLDYEADTGNFWFSTYTSDIEYQTKYCLYRVDASSETVLASYKFYTPYGFHALGDGKYLVSIHHGPRKNCEGYAYETDVADFERGITSKESEGTRLTELKNSQ